MKSVIISFLLIFILQSLCLAEECKYNDIVDRSVIYNIIFDIGVYDRDSYIKIIDSINAGNMPKAAIYFADDKESGITDYSASFLIKNKEGNVVFHKFFTGYYKNDHSDISKIQLDRIPPMTREQFLDGLSKNPKGYVPLTE